MKEVNIDDALKSSIFPATRWTLIERLHVSNWSEAALDKLCGMYRPPVFRFIRRAGSPYHDAQDLTQDFFQHSLRVALFESADRKRGKLRSYLTASLSNFIIDKARTRLAKKRGGGSVHLPLDNDELRARLSEHSPLAPDEVMALEYSRDLFDGVWKQLADSFAARGEEALFLQLIPFLVADSENRGSQVAAAKAVGLTPTAFWNRLQRLKKAHLTLLRNRIAQTVDPGDITEELHYLQGLFASHPR